MTTRTALRGFGEALSTPGVVIRLFMVFLLFYTNLEANSAKPEIREGLDRSRTAPGVEPKHAPLGEGFALMRIPKLGRDWVKPVVEGAGQDQLAKGLGHYPPVPALAWCEPARLCGAAPTRVSAESPYPAVGDARHCGR